MNLEQNFKGFGDALANFLYSLAKSKATGVWTGEKVSNHVLSQALIFSKVGNPGGMDKHEKGDYVESFIAQAWIDQVVTIEEAVDVLVEVLKTYDLEEDEQKAMTDAFCSLLDYIQEKPEVPCTNPLRKFLGLIT
ncbi:MAG: ribonuclease III family protein [Candidatus Methanofastidiosia archaeon]